MNDNKEQPKISVIIPVYNMEKFIRECLDSVISQSMHDLEIICIDNGSTDSSGQILDEYAAKDSRLIVVHKPNDGLSSRNVGMERVSGEYVIFLDGDDFIEPEMTHKLLTTCIKKQKKLALIWCSFYTESTAAIRI